MTLSTMSFNPSEMSTAEVEASEALYGALAHDIRDLVDVAIRTQVDADRVAAARALIVQASGDPRRGGRDRPGGHSLQH